MSSAHVEVFADRPASAQHGASSAQYCCAKPAAVEAPPFDELQATTAASAASAATVTPHRVIGNQPFLTGLYSPGFDGAKRRRIFIVPVVSPAVSFVLTGDTVTIHTGSIAVLAVPM